MSRQTWFRLMVVAICGHYWANAGSDLVDSGGSLYGWIHMVLACAVVPAVIGEAWRYSRNEPYAKIGRPGYKEAWRP